MDAAGPPCNSVTSHSLSFFYPFPLKLWPRVCTRNGCAACALRGTMERTLPGLAGSERGPFSPHWVEWGLAPDLSLNRKLAYGPLLTACLSDLPLWSGLVAGTRKCSLAACRCLIPGKAPTPNLLAVFELCLFKPNPPYLKPHCNTHCGGGVGRMGGLGGSQ